MTDIVRQRVLGLCLLFLIFDFFFLGLGGYDLTAPDEPRFALVAREMLSDNHWILPHRNQIPYPDKPPLFFWTIAAFSALGGGTVTAWTGRLPSALAAAVILFLMWGWSRPKKQDDLLPLLTVIVLMSCVKFFFQARIAQIDMVLCLFTTASLLTGYNALTGKPYSPFWLGMFMGLGILAKGPVGYLVPAGSMALFAVFGGRETWRNYPVKALVWGLVPVMGWLALLVLDVALHNQWDYLKNLLFKQTVVRYLDPWHHYQPFYYFWVSILYDFLPWTPFLLLSLPLSGNRRRSLDSREKFSWAVILFTMVFFSLSRGKRNLYILPLFPFAAYVSAVKLKELMKRDVFNRWESLAAVFPGLLFLILGAALVLPAGGWVTIPAAWIDSRPPQAWILTGGILLLIIALGIFGAWMKHRFRPVVAGTLAAMLVVNFLFFSVVLPWLDPHRSARGFMQKANALIRSRSGDPVVGMVDFRAEYRFYGDYPLVELANEGGGPDPGLPKIENFFDKYPQGWLIVREKHWEQFAKTHAVESEIHLMQKIGDRKNMMLVSKKDQSR